MANPTGMSPCPSEARGTPRFVVLGNPKNRRVEFFAQAALRVGCAPVEVVAWRDFLQRPEVLSGSLRPQTVLRIESPGENFEVERALLLRGVEDVEPRYARFRRDEIAGLEFECGRVLPLRQWYCGWRMALAQVAEALRAVPDCRVMNAPEEIAAMFDKARCHEIFASREVPVPLLLGLPGSFAELHEMMAADRCRRVFLKPCHSSSASGVIALEESARGMQAFTSLEMVRTSGALKLFNSLKVRRYTSVGQIVELTDAICRERCVAEKWLPKAGFEGQRMDLRVVVIAGVAAHVVVRQSKGPMTNLHLGSRRGDAGRLREHMGEKSWRWAMTVAEQAAAAFPKAQYAGVDVLVAPSFRRAAVAEINAFGDLLPGVLHDGRDTYTAEIAALLPGR